MRISVLGGCGAWPAAGQACSGYLVEQDGFRLLVDPGYATLPRLLSLLDADGCSADDVDAVLVSHGHPDHCADVHPLLRARVLGGGQRAPLPLYAPLGALDRVLDLDGPGRLRDACQVTSLMPQRRVRIGPFQVDTWLLPHHVPNLGLRLAAGGSVLAYTGDTGPSPDIVALALGCDAFLAEATYPERAPGGDGQFLSTARQAGENAARAGAGRLILTHLWPGTSRDAALEAAGRAYSGAIAVAAGGLVVDLG
jgi:ribonuclease BN (tRNA processing enzyme)